MLQIIFLSGRETFAQMKVRVDGDLLNFSDDASFRRYFRFSNNSGGLVFVNAPPEKEDNQSFVKIADALKKSGIPCPLVQAFNFDFGYLAVSDLGDRLFLDEIENRLKLKQGWEFIQAGY